MSVDPQHLIVIRGNSGAGKTTLARGLQVAMGRGTANIGQDHFDAPSFMSTTCQTPTTSG